MNAVTGIITGVAPGVATISYVLSTGCIATTQLTVNILSPILGPTSLCDGGSITLSDATGGGTWSSSSTTIATISSSGTVSGVGSGVTIISYAYGTACVVFSAVTVNAAPGAIGGIGGALCLGSTTTLTDATSGGTWSSSNTSIATVGLASGIVVGGVVVTEVTCTITYTLPTGCTATTIITVNTSPATILGPTSLCVGSGITLSDGTTGGTWSTASTVIAVNATTGAVTSTAAGAATITYTAATSCYTTIVVTANNTPASITGAGQVCAGANITLADGTSGGTWSSSATGIATVGSSTGVVGGVSGGVSTISYGLSGCYATADVTVNATPAGITGASFVCAGSSITLNDATAGGTWSSSATSVATIGSSTGVVNGIAGGSTNITYDLGTGCFTTRTFTIEALPTLSVASNAACGGADTLIATTSSTSMCSWSPGAGLSCSLCDTVIANVSATTTYTVTVMDSFGCVNSTTINVNGNRISGFITMTTTPTDTVKVWLIQFNSTDSSLTAEDSTLSCMDGGTPYYEFDNKPAGNYMVKAMLLGGVAGTSGYIPTYGLSTAHWDTATNIVHVSATDTQHINMIYGTVPTGPGFIGGLIISGAGRGTASGVPVAGMLVYLEDTLNHELTYTYTNTSGRYSFTGLQYGHYRVYPEDYQYHTTPWISITLSATSDSVSSANFYQNTTNHTIIPGSNLHTTPIGSTTKISVYPNPAINELNVNWTNEQTGKAHISITDVTGRMVYESAFDMAAASGNVQLDISNINSGIYFIAIKSESISYTNKLLIQR